MSSIVDDIKSGLSFAEELFKQHEQLFGMLIDGLSAIAQLTSNTTDDKAVEVLRGVQGVLTAIGSGMAGAVTADEVRKHLADFNDAIAANDARALATLQARFPAAPPAPIPTPKADGPST